MNIWDLDKETQVDEKADAFYQCLEHKVNGKFRVGQVIQFWTGYNNDLRAQASIKAIDGEDIFVYNDCYWYPIQDTNYRDIKFIK